MKTNVKVKELKEVQNLEIVRVLNGQTEIKPSVQIPAEE